MRKTTAARAADPETSPDALLDLAVSYPEAVLGNPALPLLALEDPGAVADIRRAAGDAILETAVIDALDVVGPAVLWAFTASLIERWGLDWPEDRRGLIAARTAACEAAIEAMRGVPFNEANEAWREERLRQLELLRDLVGGAL